MLVVGRHEHEYPLFVVVVVFFFTACVCALRTSSFLFTWLHTPPLAYERFLAKVGGMTIVVGAALIAVTRT